MIEKSRAPWPQIMCKSKQSICTTIDCKDLRTNGTKQPIEAKKKSAEKKSTSKKANKGSERPDEEVLTAYPVTHLQYERKMLGFNFQKLHDVNDDMEWAAMFELFCIHARNLEQFLRNKGVGRRCPQLLSAFEFAQAVMRQSH